MSREPAKRSYIPTAYVDEICPPLHPHPNDWLVAPVDGGWDLAPNEMFEAHPETAPAPLSVGSLVLFDWRDDYEDLQLALLDGERYGVSPLPDPAESLFCLPMDPDAIFDSIKDLVAFLRQETDPPAQVRVKQYHWCEASEPWRLIVTDEGASFELERAPLIH